MLLNLEDVTASDGLALTDDAALFAQLDLARPELDAVRAAVAEQDWKAAKAAWAVHMRDQVAPRWTWSYRDRDAIMRIHREKFGGFEKFVPQAEKVLRREFRFCGVDRTLARDIDWNDPDYDYEWCNVLNRHGYWKPLGYAWWATGDAKYAEDWVGMLRDWVADNPLDARKQPWRTLEVGFRASSWFSVINLFMDAPAFDPEAKAAITRSLVEHARLLYRDIHRKGYRDGNWQLSKAKGMATVGIMMPEFKEAAAWRELGLKILGQHMQRGVYPDGGHCELTPGYHFHCMNAFLSAVILARKNGYDIPGIAERHEKMAEFLMHLTKPDRGYAPAGDAGNGSKHRPYIKQGLALGALLYNRPDMRYLAGDDIPESWIWLFPEELLNRYPDLPTAAPSVNSHMMPHSRYAVMRTGWEKPDRWFLFDCAPWGGNHSHGDRLHVSLYSGRDLLIDVGQYSYDQPLAKTYFRSAAAHNILLIDEKDQPRANPQVLSWNVADRVEFVSGRITKDGITHQRSVLFLKPDYWVVADHVTGEGRPQCTRLFHFPQVTVQHDATSARTAFETGDNVWIGRADDARVEMRKGWLVLDKGKAVEGPVAAFVSKQPLPAAMCTVLVPFGSNADIPELERLPPDTAETVALRVRFADGRTDLIAIAPDVAPLRAGTHTANALALCLRSNHHQKPTLDIIQPKPLSH